jgi:hypothetical protein
LKITREATLNRLRQVLLNLTLRLRERYALIGVREEQLNFVIADISGPLRACAAAILGLEGEHVSSPREALQILARRLPGHDRTELLESISEVRRQHELEPSVADATIDSLLELLRAMYLHIGTWSGAHARLDTRSEGTRVPRLLHRDRRRCAASRPGADECGRARRGHRANRSQGTAHDCVPARRRGRSAARGSL